MLMLYTKYVPIEACTATFQKFIYRFKRGQKPRHCHTKSYSFEQEKST